MSANETQALASTRFAQVDLSSHEAEVFDRLCEQSGLTPSAASSVMVAFVCRSVSGTREVKGGDLNAMLTEDFGDLQALLTRIRAVTDKGEGVVENGRSLMALLAAEIVAVRAAEVGESS